MTYPCEFCGSVLKTERGRDKHMCHKKKLIKDTGEINLVRAYDMFDFWFRYSGLSKKSKSIDQFVKSPYFSLFVSLHAKLEPEAFPSKSYVKWLVDSRVPSKSWESHEFLSQFRKHHVRESESYEAVAESLKYMASKCDESGVDISDFFTSVGPGECVQWVRDGKLSPWVIFLSSKSHAVLDRMSAEQAKYISELVDLSSWESKISSTDNAEASSLLREVGL